MTSNLAIAINCFRRGGGMESYTFDLVRGLTAQGTAVDIYAAQIDPTVPEYQLVNAHKINQTLVPKKLRPFLFTRQLRLARAHRREPLIACNPSDHADIFVCGGTHLGYLQNMAQTPNLIDHLTIQRNRSNYASAQSIMAHSHLMKRELVTLYGVPSEKIRVVHPPADTARFYPDPAEAAATRARYSWRDDETVFLFPSTGHKRKGLDLLADFFEHTDLPVKLAVAGSPLPRPMNNVVSLGFCQNMPELYRAADYTVMASLYEPFGLVGVESVLCGTKVVLSDNMACTEVMNEEAGFFFSSQDPATLAAAIKAAVLLKQGGVKHKIANPLTALTYNPTLAHHIATVYQMLEAV
ncbi:glycosyltransferase family 4 protein [Neisseria perflava]|uniref:glycosyltransferase family 4 protein n=1 Tax=Neisseria perflava TaxID=33053 RepID=UPI00209C78CA|nr:glycosyltransferase family 4 protein [Neisseria perflava]MCP1661080.1 glycosyltransferase involved in cell wall biosynthesis [Neisseria perflava]MCP1771587.1 glycosyltransferase involved in cell wall biosynthesis [Neisseria perflava]